MLPLIILVSLVISNLGHAADGPRNTGNLRFSKDSTHDVKAHLQMDLVAFKEIFGQDDPVNLNSLKQLVTVKALSNACELVSKKTLSSNNIVSEMLFYNCGGPTDEIAVSMPQGLVYPANFSLGIIGVSGHIPITNATEVAVTNISKSKLFFQLGTDFFVSNHYAGIAAIGRQAALWFGGSQRLPVGLGLILLIIAIVIFPLNWQTSIAILSATLGVAALSNYIVLSAKVTQSIFASLGLSQFYFGLVAAVFVIPTFRLSKKPLFTAIVLSLLAGVFYGLELAVVFWQLETVVAEPLHNILGSFWFGIIGFLAIALTLLFIAERIGFGRLKVFSAGDGLVTFKKTVAGTGFICCSYLLLCLFIRFRF